MKIKHLIRMACASVLLLSGQGAFAQHIIAGALGTNQSDQLFFLNGASFVSTSGYIKSLTFTNAGTYAGYFQGGLTFVSSSTTSTNADFSSNAPALGSFIGLRFESVVSGPVGGQFGFWNTGVTSAPSSSLNVGDTNGSYLFNLSDLTLGAGNPGADPFGHLHGRRFTATLPGDYLVGFRLLDLSTNGTGAGPIHSAGDLFYMTFSAVPEPSVVALGVLGAIGMAGVIRRRVRKIG